MVDEHRHCPCNGVWLCGVCHSTVHRSPEAARKDGWIVGRFVDKPFLVPANTTWGLRHHLCEGTYEFVTSRT